MLEESKIKQYTNLMEPQEANTENYMRIARQHELVKLERRTRNIRRKGKQPTRTASSVQTVLKDVEIFVHELNLEIRFVIGVEG
jgi:hypothetical protein